MARTVHRSANGRIVDMEALRLSNESTVAIGNMNVNARGDELGPGGKVVKSKAERMNELYALHTMVPTDSKEQVSMPTVVEHGLVEDTETNVSAANIADSTAAPIVVSEPQVSVKTTGGIRRI